MLRFILVISVFVILGWTVSTGAEPEPQISRGLGDVIYGRAVGAAAAAKQDTLYLLGGPDRLDGKFQDAAGSPTWHGWTSVDRTYDPSHYWSVTDDPLLVCGAGSRSLWVGTRYPPEATVPGPGYGNNWNQSILFTHTVANPTEPSTVTWRFLLCHDTEPNYDYVYAEYRRGGTWIQLARWDGTGTVTFEETFAYQPGEYIGPLGNQIELRIRFLSDGAWSDEDGLWPTERGAAQIDDILVWVDGELVEAEDFEGLAPSQPGEQLAFGNWFSAVLSRVGDFAALYTHLQDLDPCAHNHSAQVAFIDDGVVVPGTGGTLGHTWTYGPGGYIVNYTGGLMGSWARLFNSIVSPPIAVPPQVDGVHLRYGVYRHTADPFSSIAPLVVDLWEVRSIDSGNPADLADAPWRSFNFVYFGGPEYVRMHLDATSLLLPGRTHVQVALSVWDIPEYYWPWGEPTPAPYFDNVAIVGVPIGGPSLSARAIDLFQDSFPASGTLDLDDLAANSIRLDMARSISPTAHAYNMPGDSILVDVTTMRAGYALHGPPRIVFALKANPLFDAVRDLSDPLLQDLQVQAGVITGHVLGRETHDAWGNLIAGRWNFDLPDEGFFFPGDILHYCIEAQDILGGDPATIGTARLPADLAHFGDFDQYLKFNSTFTVRGLPTLFSAEPGDQPRVLWWNHYDILGGENEWLNALANLGWRHGIDFDMYYTNGPASAAGNGLGGRATAAQLAGYDVLLFTSGDLATRVLGVGATGNLCDDIGLLTAWFAQGGKSALLTGNSLATSLLSTGGAAHAFLTDYLGANRLVRDIRPTIDGQRSPLVRPVAGNGVIGDGRTWIAYGGCPKLSLFDGIEPVGGAQRLAYYTPPGGEGDPYPYAAAVRNVHAESGATVVFLPYDLMTIHDAGTANKALSARARVLQDILASFGQTGGSAPTSVAPDAVLAVSSFPNPFNPATTIRLTVPRPGEVSLRIFNVRGELVRTLVDGRLEAGVHDLAWDGATDQGNQAASGVYFHEARADGEAKAGKMVLVR